MKPYYLPLMLLLAACGPTHTPTQQPTNPDTTRMEVQPGTGLVLWPDEAADLHKDYGDAITLEFQYALPCRVVKGKVNGQLQYDWTWLETLLNDIAKRHHQAILRWRYEYPSGTDVDGKKGTTAVPDYIKQQPDYHETYSKNPGGDGPTYYADWSNSELQWFNMQFFSDFAQRYGRDPRIAFLEVGFGHWGEYHIYGTNLQLGQNFPSKEYQKRFFLQMSEQMPIPWLISIDAADDEYTPFLAEAELMRLPFGLFDDSFMHAEHELAQGEGYNETCWQLLSGTPSTRWQKAPAGGEISYYEDRDQHDFLNPDGLYGYRWEEQAAKYHITFMIANDAPEGRWGTAERFREAGLACGYKFCLTKLETSPQETLVCITNRGNAPIYRDAYPAIGSTRSTQSLKGLLPGDTLCCTIPVPTTTVDSLRIVSDYILPTQQITLARKR